MWIGRTTVVFLACLALTACGSPGGNAEVSFDRNTDFVSDKSYQWVKQPIRKYAPSDLAIRESVLTTVKLHITDRLSAKNFAPSDTPRFLVNYVLGPSQNVRVRPGVGGFGAGKYSPFITTETETVLVIDVQDAQSGQSLWRGWAPITLVDKQDRLDAIKGAADAILYRFPPS